MNPLQVNAQNELPVPSVIPSMIRQEANRIQNPQSINRFLSKLHSLEKGDSVNVKILHIGDSHIYADLMTGMVRQLLQKRFGMSCSKQLYRFKPSDFQDTLRTSFITPVYADSIKTSGVCYYIAGANGAEYATFNQKYEFFKETALLQPDLVIISMGTNEAFGNLDQKIFENNIDAFVSQIRYYNPAAEILITTPGDALKRKRYLNPNIGKAVSILVNYATASNIAVWDLNSIMGGYGSMKKWFTAGLSQNDRIHFSREGYYIQGLLLFNALMNELDTPATER
jgi:hypothetical protein